MAERNDQQQKRLHQWAERAARMDRPSTGRFLSAEERSLALKEARQAMVSVSFDGGWADCERVQVCFHPAEDEPEFTAVWLEISWNAKFDRVEHSDLFGSLMALGLDRALFGDLVVQPEGKAYLYCMPECAVQLTGDWQQAGRAPIRVRQLEESPAIIPPEGRTMRDTVASMRLDSVLASGMRISRAKAAEIIRQGLVSVDHQEEERVDRQLAQGQLLSVRHFGRIRVREVGEPTKKDRLPVTLEIFSK